MIITNSKTHRIGDVTLNESTTLTVGRVDFDHPNMFDCMRDQAIHQMRVHNVARPARDWTQDLGPVLWWNAPISEQPWVGTPLDSDWPGYHTYFTTFERPRNLEGGF